MKIGLTTIMPMPYVVKLSKCSYIPTDLK